MQRALRLVKLSDCFVARSVCAYSFCMQATLSLAPINTRSMRGCGGKQALLAQEGIRLTETALPEKRSTKKQEVAKHCRRGKWHFHPASSPGACAYATLPRTRGSSCSIATVRQRKPFRTPVFIDPHSALFLRARQIFTGDVSTATRRADCFRIGSKERARSPRYSEIAL